MCGIVYAHSFDGSPVNNAVLQQFDMQRHRGTQGFGIYDGQELNMVHATTEDKILKWLCKYDSNMLLMHHRYPTSTANVKKAAHPFSTKDYFGKHEYILVHNGVLDNHTRLFADHIERGIEYQSLLKTDDYNDSESLLWDFALTMEGVQDAPQAIGDIAFICLKKTDGVLTHMYFGRNNGRPLNLIRTATSIELSSEGDGDAINPNTLYTWDYKAQTLTTAMMFFDEYEWTAPKHTGTYISPPAEETYYPYGSNYDDGDTDLVDMDEDDEEYNRKWSGQSYGWLGRQIDRYIAAKHAAPVQVYEPDPDTQEMVLVNPTAGDVVSTYKPTKSEAELLVLDYLKRFQGHFEQAYWALEVDYEDVVNSPYNAENLRKKSMIEAAIDYLNHDPEYENEESVSSLVQTAWLA